MKFIDKGRFEIFDGYGQDGSIIFKAATTCYRSEDKTKRTADDFIKMLKSNKHLAMLEFSFFTLKIEPKHPVTRIKRHMVEDIYISLIHNKHLKIDFDFHDFHNFLIIDGNGRAWLEVLNSEKGHTLLQIYPSLFKAICNCLHQINPILFENKGEKSDIIEVLNISGYRDKEWIAVKLYDVSRGLTHELVRHRVMSFAQMSTRYVNMEDFDFVFPQEFFSKMTEGERKALIASLDSTCESIKDSYSLCLSYGLSKNEARQILPNGITNEICVAGRVGDWKHLFELRCHPSAHWEIRTLMTELRDEFVKRCLI